MEFVQNNMKSLFKVYFFLFFLITPLVIEAKSSDSALHATWKSVENSKYKVWFQNWSGYTRLFITINEDTISIKPNKYAVQTKTKPYLFPQDYDKVLMRQLIGNIIWDNNNNISWEDGHVNTFTYLVDRSNPKMKLPQKFEGISVIEDGLLRLELISNPDKKYHMSLKPTYVD